MRSVRAIRRSLRCGLLQHPSHHLQRPRTPLTQNNPRQYPAQDGIWSLYRASMCGTEARVVTISSSRGVSAKSAVSFGSSYLRAPPHRQPSSQIPRVRNCLLHFLTLYRVLHGVLSIQNTLTPLSPGAFKLRDGDYPKVGHGARTRCLRGLWISPGPWRCTSPPPGADQGQMKMPFSGWSM